TAFLIKLDGRLLLVTAHHIFGPDAGLSRAYAWNELPALVHGVVAGSPDGRSELSAAAPLSIPGAMASSPGEYEYDVAAVSVTDAGAFAVLELAEKQPQPGDPVYLLAQTRGSAELRHAAHVIPSPRALCFLYEEQLDLTATSGAPVVDAEGKVVGINVSGGD